MCNQSGIAQMIFPIAESLQCDGFVVFVFFWFVLLANMIWCQMKLATKIYQNRLLQILFIPCKSRPRTHDYRSTSSNHGNVALPNTIIFHHRNQTIPSVSWSSATAIHTGLTEKWTSWSTSTIEETETFFPLETNDAVDSSETKLNHRLIIHSARSNYKCLTQIWSSVCNKIGAH